MKYTLATNYLTKAALVEALAAGTPTAVRTGGNVWLTGPITIEGPNTEPTWNVAAIVENGFIVTGSVE